MKNCPTYLKSSIFHDFKKRLYVFIVRKELSFHKIFKFQKCCKYFIKSQPNYSYFTSKRFSIFLKANFKYLFFKRKCIRKLDIWKFNHSQKCPNHILIELKNKIQIMFLFSWEYLPTMEAFFFKIKDKIKL